MINDNPNNEDFVTKMCLACNFISSQKSVDTFIRDSQELGDEPYTLDYALKVKKLYETLSSVFTDIEISVMATLLNNDNSDAYMDERIKESL